MPRGSLAITTGPNDRPAQYFPLVTVLAPASPSASVVSAALYRFEGFGPLRAWSNKHGGQERDQVEVAELHTGVGQALISMQALRAPNRRTRQ
jgi:hypothetical protein